MFFACLLPARTLMDNAWIVSDIWKYVISLGFVGEVITQSEMLNS